MSEPPAFVDDDPTDELPALAITASMRMPPGPLEPAAIDDTGERTLVLGIAALEATAEHASAALAAEIERWSARCAAAEQAVADKTLLVADLDAAMAVARRSLENHKRDAEALAAKLAERNDALEAALAEAARLRDELAAKPTPAAESAAAPPRVAQSADAQRLLEEYAALAHYVDQRQRWWEKANVEIAALGTKTAALEHELAERDRRLAAAEARAEQETRRASEYREQAIAYAHQAREHAQRVTPPVPDSINHEERRANAAEIEELRAELDRVGRALADEVAARALLERTVAEQTRELAARDERILSLQRELKVHRDDLGELGLKTKIAGELPATADERVGPTLVCLTGDAPERVVLGPSTTFGRGGQCDVQILTHYVSREHARIVLTPEGAFVEDLGSRNGVYVNAGKVSRARLRTGDTIKIGETQFRFVELVAH